MKSTLRLLPGVGFLCIFLFTSCSEPEVLPSDEEPSYHANASTEFYSPSSTFPTYKWFTFFPRSLAQTQYNRSVSTDGISWGGVAVLPPLNSIYPVWIKSVYYDGAIYLFFRYNAYYHMAITYDGINWGQTTLLHGLGFGLSIDDWPEFGVVNGQLKAYKFHNLWGGNVSVEVYGFDGIDFALESQQNIMPHPGVASNGCTFAELNGKFYLIGAYGDWIFKTESTDGINWSAAEGLCGPCFSNGSKINDAISFNGAIYFSFKEREPNNRIGLLKYDGTNSSVSFITDVNNVILRTKGVNVPLATDGNKLVVSYRGNGANDKNYVVYSTTGTAPWYVRDSGGTSYWNDLRDIIYASGN